ncbi:FAD-binding protein [Micromonospora sp. NBC_01655]|uniref:FAD-binding oxidoreductase n=1 Tax=Micromonospora sp. NBC_01655 TaxID=2975983 RepID=UPI0022576874|nr:FAD-binding protein [Micromonospora sp. NBC_01655]MCX4469515.1 FAD-binding protein [Micromonospora sp. NBC_01655]
MSVGPADPRYADLVNRGYNRRFVGQPESVRIVHTAAQIAAVLNEAVATGKRVVVRSGGHCFESLVDDPAVQIIIDVSEMRAVYYDAVRQAIAVQSGATLGQVYRTMFLNWGVTIPGGICPEVGVGGHVAGGGYGPLSRRYGLVVDHLYAVEVVTVDATGQARTVVATSDPGDPNRELWWAHTGGGGGSFGVVTRYWFRSPGAAGRPPQQLLPAAPAAMLSKTVTWSWAQLTEADFTRLVRNHGAWNAGNAGSTAPSLHSGLHLNQRAVQPGFTTSIELDVQIDANLPNAEGILDGYIAAVGAGVTTPPTITRTVQPFLKFVFSYETDTGEYGRIKNKSAYLRAPWTDAQIATVYQHLTGPLVGGLLSILLYSYGVKINTVPSAATASPQRDSIMKAWYSVFWADPNLDALNVSQIRAVYRDVHAATGGVPVPDARTDGCYINYPDLDLADPAWNTSGVSAAELYYRGGYPRLQAVKARWDPRNVLRHGLSVALPTRRS